MNKKGIMKTVTTVCIASALAISSIPYINIRAYEIMDNMTVEEFITTNVSDFTYEPYADHVEITSYNAESESVIIPDKIDNKPVTVITDNAFIDNVNIKRIVLPNTIKRIGANAFKGCTSLTDINIPDSVISIGVNAFNNTAITFTTIDGIDYIDNWCVSANKNITVANIKDGTVGICDYISSQAYNLTDINIPTSLKYIGACAFANTSIKNIIIPNNVIYIGDCAFSYSKIESIKLSDNITSISPSMFNGCTKLKDVQLPNKLMTIESSAFMDCSNLTNIELPNNLTIINNNAFSWSGLTSITIPNSVGYIKDYAFAYCKDLTNIKLSESLESIGNYAFTDCDNISDIIIPNKVQAIYDGTFSEMDKLKTIYFPKCLNYLGVDVFKNTSISSIYGYNNDYVEVYSMNNNIPFISISDNTTTTTEHITESTTTTTESGITVNADNSKGDINGDGTINSTDASLILSYYSYTSSGGTLSIDDYIAEEFN